MDDVRGCSAVPSGRHVQATVWFSVTAQPGRVFLKAMSSALQPVAVSAKRTWHPDALDIYRGG